MNFEIMEVSNRLVYDNRLRCGSASIAGGRLSLSKPLAAFPNTVTSVPWLLRCTDPAFPVVFVNTDGLRTIEGNSDLETFTGTFESNRGTVVNLYEVQIIKQIHDALRSCGMRMENLGVVSSYRSQVHALKESLYHVDDAFVGGNSVCDVSTVDKFQGRDMDAMILSLVRSNCTGAVGTLLRDWRRVNVAITRSKYKLVLVGSLLMMDAVPILKAMSTFMQEKGYIVQAVDISISSNSSAS